MQRPGFVTFVSSCLILDLVSLVALPIFGYLSLLIILLLVPIMLATAAPAAMAWLRDQVPNRCASSALSLAMCGSGLIFLLLTLGLTLLDNQGGGDIWQLILYFYLYLVALRSSGAAFYSVIFSPVTLFTSRGVAAKASSVSALLNSLVGLYLFRQLATQEPQLYALLGVAPSAGADPGSYVFLLVVLLVSFLSGLVWGAAVQYAARQLRSPRQA